MTETGSQQVSWWSVHEFVSAALSHAEVTSWPMAGTPGWCALADGDPRKLAAVLCGGEHWALRIETCQEARAEASRDVAEAADWNVVSRNHRIRADFFAQRPWLKRAAS